MAKYGWIITDDGREIYRRLDTGPEPKRSRLPFPNIMSDMMAPVQSMATGKFYDSKSAIRAEYKRLGMIEIGNDPARLRPRQKPKVDPKQVKTALEKAEAKFNRGERVNRHKIAQA